MSLKVQIVTLFFSFLFGFFLGVMFKLNEKMIYNGKRYQKILISFFFVIVNVLLYFIILKRINYGILHIYEIIMIMLGGVVEYFAEKKLYKFERRGKK